LKSGEGVASIARLIIEKGGLRLPPTSNTENVAISTDDRVSGPGPEFALSEESFSASI
jgi:hypothetical protein